MLFEVLVMVRVHVCEIDGHALGVLFGVMLRMVLGGGDGCGVYARLTAGAGAVLGGL